MVLKVAPDVGGVSQGGQRSGRRVRRAVRSLKSGAARDPRFPAGHRRGAAAKGVEKSPGDRSKLLPPDIEVQLSDLPVAASEFGIPKPSDSLVDEVRRIVWGLQTWTPKGYFLYLMPDGSVAVDIRGIRPDGIFISVKDDGSAHCSGESAGKVWHKPYPSSREIPDDALLDEISRLRSGAYPV